MWLPRYGFRSCGATDWPLGSVDSFDFNKGERRGVPVSMTTSWSEFNGRADVGPSLRQMWFSALASCSSSTASTRTSAPKMATSFVAKAADDLYDRHHLTSLANAITPTQVRPGRPAPDRPSTLLAPFRAQPSYEWHSAG